MDTYFSGFTIQNGSGMYDYQSDGISGGGIFVGENSSPLLDNLIVQDNTAEKGGAVINKQTGGTLRLANSIIRNNNAVGNYQLNGGGIHGEGGGLGSFISNVEIYGNYANYMSGGIHLADHPIIVNSIIRDNRSEVEASAVYAHNMFMSNCCLLYTSPSPRD